MSRYKCFQCGANHSVAIYKDGKYCFSCGDYKQQRTLLEETERKNNKSKLILNETFSNRQIEFLSKYYFFPNLFVKVFNKENTDNIIFLNPNCENCMWERQLNNVPKWILHGENTPFIIKNNNFSGTIIICEDIISAARCAYFQDSLSLCGTKINDDQYKILLNYKNIILWLDGDIAGIRATDNIFNRLKLFSNISIIRTKKDPKCYSNEEIRLILKRGYHEVSY